MKEFLIMKKWKCLVCGQIVESETAPEACPLCKAPAEKFVKTNAVKVTKIQECFFFLVKRI